MRPFFHDHVRQKALWDAAQQWLGTPFFPHAASRGAGVDCVHLMHELYVEIEAISPMELPGYTLDRAKHSTQTQLLTFLLTSPSLAGRFTMVPPAIPAMPGDLIGIRSGHVDHHLAMHLPWNKVIHAIEDHGVILTESNDEKLIKRTLYVLRLMEVNP